MVNFTLNSPVFNTDMGIIYYNGHQILSHQLKSFANKSTSESD